jgi:exosortase
MSDTRSETTSIRIATPGVRSRLFWLAAWIAATAVVLHGPLVALIRFAFSNDDASHTVLIPFLCAWVLWVDRGRVFRTVSNGWLAASVLGLLGTAAGAWAYMQGAAWLLPNRLSAYALCFVLLWLAGFVAAFGSAAARAGHFALLFLFLAIPWPVWLLDRVVYFLQKGSAELTGALFDMLGVPVLRDGFVFHLAHANIEVARECSGIRSSIALLILALLAVHFYLRAFWRQALFVLFGIFVMIVKNGVRIVTLTLLATYVDPSFLYGRLHREGGVVFFLLGIVLLIPVFLLLERSERTARRAPQTVVSPAGSLPK